MAEKNGNGESARWQRIAGIVVAVIAVGGATWGTVSYLSGLSDSINQMKAFYDAQTARMNAITDRVNRLTNTQQRQGERISQVEQALKEVETQFCGEDALRNSQLHDQLILNGLLWEKNYGTTMPSVNPPYDKVCQPRQ